MPWSGRALVYVGLGDRDAAFDELERAYQDRDFLLLWLGVDPPYEPLHDDPRYVELLNRIGLPQG